MNTSKAITFDQLTIIGEKSARHFKYAIENIKEDNRDAIEYGTYLKTFAPDVYDALVVTSSVKPNHELMKIYNEGDYYVFGGKMKRGKAWELLKEEAGSSPILTKKQVEEALMIKKLEKFIIINTKQEMEINRLSNICLKNRAITNMFYKNADQTIFEFKRMGIKLKFNVDIMIGDKPYLFFVISSARIDSVKRKFKSEKLYQRAAFIKDGLEQNQINPKKVGVIVVDTDSPASATVFHSISESSMLFGGTYVEYLRKLRGAIDSNNWAGYKQEYDELELKVF